MCLHSWGLVSLYPVSALHSCVDKQRMQYLWSSTFPLRRTSTKNNVTMLSSTFSHQCDEFLMAARVCAIFSCVIFVHFPGLIDCASHCVCGFLWDVLSVLRQISHSSPDHSYVCCFCVFLPHISHIYADFVCFWCFDGRIWNIYLHFQLVWIYNFEYYNVICFSFL